MPKAAGFDPDAQLFITNASITDTTQQNAVNNLVVALKGYNIWTKMKALYPFVGGTASQHKFNLKNPLDTDAAFRLVFSGGWTHDQFGANPNGTNCIGNTFLNPSTHITSNLSSHMSYYGRESIGNFALADMGVAVSTLAMAMYINYLGVGYYDQNNQTTGRLSFSMSGITTQGLFIGTRTSSTVHKVFKNSIQQGTTNTQTMTSLLPNNSFYIGAYNGSGGTIFGANQCALASIGDGLTDTEAANMYTAVQAFQTTLSRNV